MEWTWLVNLVIEVKCIFIILYVKILEDFWGTENNQIYLLKSDIVGVHSFVLSNINWVHLYQERILLFSVLLSSEFWVNITQMIGWDCILWITAWA